jgi:ABC-type Fe3+-hydroxamate transport system substrate-binding protein
MTTAGPKPRVVSLVPSATETLLAWGVDVVACTRFCEQPAIPHVGGTKDPDVAGIVALAPDVVVVDREENRREDADALIAGGVRVHVMHVTSLADVERELASLATAVGTPSTSTATGMRRGHRPADARWARAFVPIWRRPWMTINGSTYGSTLLEHLGVANVFADSSDAYPTVALEDAAARHPDLVLLPSEPYSFRSRHVDEIVAALPSARVLHVDGQDLFWWGSRTPAALERLSGALRRVRPPVG